MTMPTRGVRPIPVPVVVLTGFLGAGKTTLLNDILGDAAFADTVVLINEFGEIGLDHLLVERVDGDMLLMASGCLCCTIRGDLVNALEALLRRLDNGRIKPFGRLVIETTGLADPVPVLQTIIGHPYLALRFRIDRVITVVDAVNGLATLARHPEAVRQVALADRLVVTKTDLADAQPERLRTRLSSINARAMQLDRHAGEARTNAIFGGAGSSDLLPKNIAQHRHDGKEHHHDAHAHDRNRHDEAIRAFSLVRDRPIDPTALTLFLDLLRHAHGPKLLRVKGLVAMADDPDRPLLLHAVQHLLHPPVRLDAWPDDDRRTRIVLIGDDLSPKTIEDLFAAVCGDIGADRPDIAALSASPLTPSRPGGLLG